MWSFYHYSCNIFISLLFHLRVGYKLLFHVCLFFLWNATTSTTSLLLKKKEKKKLKHWAYSNNVIYPQTNSIKIKFWLDLTRVHATGVAKCGSPVARGDLKSCRATWNHGFTRPAGDLSFSDMIGACSRKRWPRRLTRALLCLNISRDERGPR